MESMNKRQTISVSAQDIHDGTPEDVEACPIALALGAEFPGARIAVDGTCLEVTFGGGGGYHERALPRSAMNFVENFDAEREVEPFDFEIDPISPNECIGCGQRFEPLPFDVECPGCGQRV